MRRMIPIPLEFFVEPAAIQVASSRPKALAMVCPGPEKTIAKLRLTMPPGNAKFSGGIGMRTKEPGLRMKNSF
jgi:hypothetical protein